jgi:uncharacterized protein DUF1707
MGKSGPGVRASTSERQQAVDALQEHRDQERLDRDEFDTRVARANEVQFRGELLALFDDLPEPRPRFDATVVPSKPAITQPPVKPQDEDGSVVSREPTSTAGRFAYALFPLSGVVAVVLFFVTGSWLWFLLIPPVFYMARQLSKGK